MQPLLALVAIPAREDVKSTQAGLIILHPRRTSRRNRRVVCRNDRRMRQHVEIPPPFPRRRTFVLTPHFQISDSLDRRVEMTRLQRQNAIRSCETTTLLYGEKLLTISLRNLAALQEHIEQLHAACLRESHIGLVSRQYAINFFVAHRRPFQYT